MLRGEWRALGDRLRVVAPAESGAAAAMRRGGLRRFAIHGSLSVPAYPASHGCVRIPMFAAREFSEMAPIGTPVIVYDGP